MIEYWHWHTLHHGTETYWGGILPHSGRPGRVYHELARLGAEFEKAGDLVAALTPDADVAFLYSHPSKWPLQGHPPLAAQDGPDDSPDRRSYHGSSTLLPGRVRRGPSVADPAPRSTATRGRTAPGTGRARLLRHRRHDTGPAHRLRGGGRPLVLGPRTGYGDEEARARTDVHPPGSPGRRASGTTSSATSRTHCRSAARTRSPAAGRAGDPVGGRADGGDRGGGGARDVRASTLRPLAGRHHPPPRCGPRSPCVGTVPDPAFAEALLRWAAPSADGTRPLRPGVTSTGATARDGRRVRFLHNWSWEETSATLPIRSATRCRERTTRRARRSGSARGTSGCSRSTEGRRCPGRRRCDGRGSHFAPKAPSSRRRGPRRAQPPIASTRLLGRMSVQFSSI